MTGHGGTLVGRREELALLQAAAGRAAAGERTVVLLGGEAGIGKTRLVDELLDELPTVLTGEPPRVLRGSCLELESEGLPFAPFTAALRSLLRELGRERFDALLPVSGSVLARIIPELGEVPQEDGDALRTVLYEHVLLLLEGLAAVRPVLLVVEDAHWSDRATRDLLGFLVRRLDRCRLLVVVTYRTDELHRTHPLRPWLAALDRVPGVERLELRRFNRREVAELAESIDGAVAAEGTVEAVFRRSEGNPLFAESLLSAGPAAGAVGVPDSLRDLLLRGAEPLPAESRRVLRVAAAGGREVSHRLLAAVTGLDDEPLVDALRPVVDARLLVSTEDGYAFRHALIRDAVHDDLLPGERTRVHARFAEVLDADASLVALGQAGVEIAHHWYAAQDQTWALISAWAAARDPRVGASSQLRLLERVLELWSRVPDASERLGTDHVAVLELAAEAAATSGLASRGLSLTAQALEELAGAEDPERRALVHARRGAFLQDVRRAGGDDELATAERLLRDRPVSAARAQVWEQLASAMCDTDREAAVTLRYAREALVQARQVEDRETELRALLTLALVRVQVGEVDTALAALEEARAHDLAREAPHRQKVAVIESDVLEELGQHRDAAEVAAAATSTATAAGTMKFSSLLVINRAEPLVALGEWDLAEELCRARLDMDPPPRKRAWLLVILGDLLLARGEVAAAREAVEETARVWPGGLPEARLSAEVALAEGRPDVALAVVLAALEIGLTRHAQRYGWPLVVTGLHAVQEVRRHGAGRQDATAEAALARLAATAEGLAVVGPAMRAWAATAAAELAVVRGVEDAAPPWVEALLAWDEVEHPYARGRVLVRAAADDLATGARERARDRLHEALETAIALGSEALRAEVEQVARRAGLALLHGTDGAGASAGDGGLGLTPREVEVLRLVAAGRSNRQIAEELFIASKTASVHVSNILAKLGVSGRGEAAATAVRLRLFA